MPTNISRVPQIRVVEAANAPRTRRINRRPQHKFNIESYPYAITPFMIAPVLPGETLKNLLMQSRVVTDPIVHPLIGWHKEYYFFYVKHRAFTSGRLFTAADAALLQTMMLDPTTSTAGLKAGANDAAFYTYKGGMRFVEMCYVEVVEEFFRDEGEAWNVATIGNYAAAQVDFDHWGHSLKKESATGDDTELPGVDEQEELDIIPGFSTQYAQWEIMRDAGMVDLTYEDYLRSYGVDIPKAEDEGQAADVRHKPELIRFVRDWKYPTNHVEPTTGTPSSAVSWSIAERADKDRFFKEPGFLFGVTLTRPKLYLGNQKGAAVGLLEDAYGWLPAVLRGLPYTGIKEVLDSATDGILQNQTEDYWLDLADLYIRGDQFTNRAMTAANNHGVAMPVVDLNNKKYPTAVMLQDLFTGGAGGNWKIREDGVAHLTIASAIRDTTP